jgi:hypothetical protein
MSERFADPPGPAWEELSRDQYDLVWDRFDDAFGFRPSMSAEGWPAIREPRPSVTFDLSVIEDGPARGSAYDAINAEALRSFVWALPEAETMLALDWQHPAYRFHPARQAGTWAAEWKIPVYPDGDYYAFLTEDFASGTFGHPWERTICVFGERLVSSLARSFETWLPAKRKNGEAP